MAFTAGEWQSWLCQFLRVPLPSMLALRNIRKCPTGHLPEASLYAFSHAMRDVGPSRLRLYSHLD